MVSHRHVELAECLVRARASLAAAAAVPPASAPPTPPRRRRRWLWGLFSLPPALMEGALLFAILRLNMFA